MTKVFPAESGHIDAHVRLNKFVLAKEKDKNFAFEVQKKGLREYVEKMSTWEEPKEILNHNRRFDQYNF